MYRTPEMLDLYQNFPINEALDIWVRSLYKPVLLMSLYQNRILHDWHQLDDQVYAVWLVCHYSLFKYLLYSLNFLERCTLLHCFLCMCKQSQFLSTFICVVVNNIIHVHFLHVLLWQALGCVLFMLCFGVHPYEDSAKLRIINANYQIPENDREYTVFHDLISK